MTKTSILSLAIAWSLSSSALFAAALVVNMDSGGFLLKNSTGAALTAGANLTNFDGAIIQLGYFTSATSNNNNFSGAFVPLSGQGSVNFVSNTTYDTTVGDDFNQGFGPPFNQFQIKLIVDTTVQTGLPAVGTILSIRIYDETSVPSVTAKFMTISNNAWKWITPTTLLDPNSKIDMSFGDAGLRAENRAGAGGLVSTANGDAANTADLRTTIGAVPEPASATLLVVGLVSLASRRRRVAKV